MPEDRPHQNPEPGPAPSHAAGEPGKPTFELAPEPATPIAPAPPKPEIKAPGLTEGFDEDADFETDPEVERALGKRPVEAARGAVAPVEEDPFVRPGLGEPKVVALVGAGVLLAAVIAACITAPSFWWVHGMLAAYASLVHTVTGVGALTIGARLAEKRLGAWDLAAARMLFAVALFQLVFHIPMPAQVWLAPIAAAAAYSAATMVFFRLPIHQWFTVAASHFGVWILIEGLVWLNSLLVGAPTPAPVPGVAGS